MVKPAKATATVLAAMASVAVFFITVSGVSAETDVSVKLDLQNIISRDGTVEDDPLWFLSGTGTADLSVKSADNKNVKGELAVRGVLGTLPLLDIQKAYIKARLPGFRIVAGKTSLDWGEGFVFNAGDLISGTLPSAGLSAISAETFRTATDWLVSAYIPIGRFSFGEIVALPPELDTLAYPPVLASLSESAAGGRLHGNLGNVAAETGYIYNGEDNIHAVSINLQGNLLLDWYISASTSLDGDTHSPDTYWKNDFVDSSEISFGLFHTMGFDAAGSFSGRIEGLIQPGGVWEEESGGNYGVMLYGDASWNPVTSLSVSLRTLYSPIDASAFISGGLTLSPLPGFTTYVTGSVQAGEEGDTFGFGRYGDTAISSGFRYSF